MYFLEDKLKIVTAGIDGCFIFSFQPNNRYNAEKALILDPEGRSLSFSIGQRMRIESKEMWLKGMKVDEKEGLIYTWNQVQTCFNDIEDGKLVFKYKGLTAYEDYITDLIISDIYKYFLTSTYKG